MTSFYVYCLLFAAIAVGFILYPWLKDRNAKKRFEVSNTNVIKQRIEEIKREAFEGLIDPEEMQTAIDEMKIALADETAFHDAQEKKAETTSLSARSAKLPLLIGAIPALFAAVWVYVDANQLSGLQDLVDATNNIDELSQRILVTPADDVRPEEFQKYALVIRQQLRKDPSDATGWQWLGRLRMSLGQTEEAVAAFDKALKISPDAQDIRMKYAQAMMMVGDDENLQNAKRQVSYLVQIAPENRNYRLLLTVVAAQLNDSDVAFANFALIKDALSADSTVYQSLVNQLRSMGASEGLLSLNNGARNGLLDNSSLDNSSLDNSSPDNSSLDNAPLDNSVVANGTRGFDVTVSIANELESKLPSTGFLILFAQDAISGSRVPLAVKKLALPQFPILLSLSADDAMIASLSLENAEQVTITARISVDEDVMTKPGELEGSLASVTVNDSMQAVTLIINKEI
ncbi:c-type cytochrome biogenesis protein CcmI [Glaciecola sp. 33A]|uniref:c-type cytochrome biogenesis protein CcmI n=1 Tax=Glaciecola sp. 33A TaxID=2057807 RepID=UPI000C342BF0|nr:c-type cytochrome biogenesis protein CcmI [Glaciecola sp. 33A]PKI02303.1 c-type cytochrome biogenesis protein CcmI [Glaciecola sp. 33A]